MGSDVMEIYYTPVSSVNTADELETSSVSQLYITIIYSVYIIDIVTAYCFTVS